MTVYPDLAFLQGMFLHGSVFVLSLTVLELRRSRWQVALLSFLSGVTSALSVFPEIPLWCLGFAGIGFTVFLLRGKTFGGTVHNTLIGCLILLLFLGARMLCSGAIFRLSVLSLGDGVYFLLPFVDGLFSVFFAIAVLWGVSVVRKKRSLRPGCFDCELDLEGKTLGVRCYADSGNFLTDPVSGSPVVILEFSVLRRGVDPAFPLPMTYEFSSRFGSRARAVPYRSVSGGGRILSAFVPDDFRVCGKSYRVVVAVTDRPLEKSGRFSGIIGPGLLEGV